MARALPTIDLAGTSFYIDIEMDEFRQVDNPENRIHFDLLGEDDQGKPMLFFDKTKLNVFAGPVGPVIPEHIEVVAIRSFISMDPVGVARKCDLPDDFFMD